MDCSMALMMLILISARGRRYGSGLCIATDLYLLGTNYTLPLPTRVFLVAIFAVVSHVTQAPLAERA
jgi:hypothetical protein